MCLLLKNMFKKYKKKVQERLKSILITKKAILCAKSNNDSIKKRNEFF